MNKPLNTNNAHNQTPQRKIIFDEFKLKSIITRINLPYNITQISQTRKINGISSYSFLFEYKETLLTAEIETHEEDLHHFPPFEIIQKITLNIHKYNDFCLIKYREGSYNEGFIEMMVDTIYESLNTTTIEQNIDGYSLKCNVELFIAHALNERNGVTPFIELYNYVIANYKESKHFQDFLFDG